MHVAEAAYDTRAFGALAALTFFELFVPCMHAYNIDTLTKAKVWERYGKVWAIYDPYVGMIWDSIDIMWDWYGV